MPLYEPPSWMPAIPAVSTGWRYAPLPFPGSDVFSSFVNIVRLSGEGFPISQNRFHRVSDTVTQNLCGSEVYRRQVSHYGKPDGHGEIESWSDSETQFDYIFTDASLPDLIDSNGVHTPRWKPVVTLKKTIDLPEGGLILPAGEPVSAERKEYPWLDTTDLGSDGKPAEKYGGETVYSSPVNHSYLAQALSSWKGLSAAARRRTRMATVVATSETTSGWNTYINSGVCYHRCNLASDLFTPPHLSYIQGWPGTVRVHLPVTQRRNAPRIWDKSNANALQIYNRGSTEEMLEDEITEGKWLDQYGRYDPGSGAAAFTAAGWQPVSFADWVYAWTQLYYSGPGAIGAVRLRTADGHSYRLAIAFKCRDADDNLVVFRSVTLTIAPGSPADLAMTVPTQEGLFPTEIVITSAQRLTGAAEFAAQKVYSGSGFFWVGGRELLGDAPYPGIGVLLTMKTRNGSRWGFPAFRDDSLPLPGDPHYRRRIFRQDHRAVCER